VIDTVDWRRNEDYSTVRDTVDWRRNEDYSTARDTVDWRRNEDYSTAIDTVHWRRNEDYSTAIDTVDWRRNLREKGTGKSIIVVTTVSLRWAVWPVQSRLTAYYRISRINSLYLHT
jgi:hypothetical protein